MDNPKITEKINGYLLEWEKDSISALIEQIHIHQDGRVTGNLQIFHNNGTGQVILLPSTQFNFSSERTRHSQAKLLGQKHSLEIEWLPIFDFLGYKVQELARQGEEVEELVTGDEIQAPNYLLYPFIVENMPNCIFGDPGAAKTEFALMLAQILMLPWKQNPLELVAPNKPIKCLYLDWEADNKTIVWQLTRLQRGMLPDDKLTIHYRRCSLPLYNDTEQVVKLVDSLSIELVIIDALGLASGGELNNTEPALNFFQALRKIKATPLVLAHNSKDPLAKKKTIYGNQHYTAEMRNVWEIVKSQEPDADEMDIALFHRKSPPFQKMHRTLGYHYVFESDATVVATQDPKDIVEFMERMGTQLRILNILKDGAKDVKEIHSLLSDITENNIRVVLYNLKKAGKVTQPEKGKYGLPAGEEYE